MPLNFDRLLQLNFDALQMTLSVCRTLAHANECCNDLSPLCLPTPTDHFNLMHCKIRVHAE
jgi:hypothetical protein